MHRQFHAFSEMKITARPGNAFNLSLMSLKKVISAERGRVPRIKQLFIHGVLPYLTGSVSGIQSAAESEFQSAAVLLFPVPSVSAFASLNQRLPFLEAEAEYG